MSKTLKLKAEVGYSEKPVLPICSNCVEFTSDRVLPEWMIERNASEMGRLDDPDNQYTVEKNGVEKNLRCTRHGFAVKKMASCNKLVHRNAPSHVPESVAHAV